MDTRFLPNHEGRGLLSQNHEGEKSLNIRILPNGDTKIDFFATCWSDFIVDNIYSEEERKKIKSSEKETGIKFIGIFCG